MAGLPGLDAKKQDHEVDHKQQHDCHFEDEHPTIGLIVIEQLVKVVECLQLFVDRPVPIAKVKTGGDSLIDSRQMPITKKLADVLQFIA